MPDILLRSSAGTNMPFSPGNFLVDMLIYRREIVSNVCGGLILEITATKSKH